LQKYEAFLGLHFHTKSVDTVSTYVETNSEDEAKSNEVVKPLKCDQPEASRSICIQNGSFPLQKYENFLGLHFHTKSLNTLSTDAETDSEDESTSDETLSSKKKGKPFRQIRKSASHVKKGITKAGKAIGKGLNVCNPVWHLRKKRAIKPEFDKLTNTKAQFLYNNIHLSYQSLKKK
jgi:transcription elongation factor Elf1